MTQRHAQCPCNRSLQAVLEQHLAKQGPSADQRIIKGIKQCEVFLNAREASPAALAKLKQQVAGTLAATQVSKQRSKCTTKCSSAPSQQAQSASQRDHTDRASTTFVRDPQHLTCETPECRTLCTA
jgi:hypothetical protein